MAIVVNAQCPTCERFIELLTLEKGGNREKRSIEASCNKWRLGLEGALFLRLDHLPPFPRCRRETTAGGWRRAVVARLARWRPARQQAHATRKAGRVFRRSSSETRRHTSAVRPSVCVSLFSPLVRACSCSAVPRHISFSRNSPPAEAEKRLRELCAFVLCSRVIRPPRVKCSMGR